MFSEIKDLGFRSIGADEAVVSWTTSIPTKTTVEVTDTATGEKSVYEDASFLKEHTLAVTNLSFSTNYVLQVLSEDEAGSLSSSSVIPFSTQASLIPPVISDVRTSTALVPGQGGKVQTIISWRTDKPSTSRVLYEHGVSASTELSAFTPLNLNLVKDHVVVTTAFKPGAVYRFRIESIDGAGHISYSKDYTILTPRQEENIVDLIIDNFEQSFGFLKRVKF
ncbi:MAG: hypothetical protein JXK93_13250 [Sphaerochaetaceae bacterium]|nr:hypothetical protein [Sphaerochaetaceae bacterium]